MLEVPAALEDATRDFTGRRWVFDTLDRWIGKDTERRLLIVGGPGTGKSTLAARLVEFTNGGPSEWQHLGNGMLAAAHFCRAQVDQTLDPRRVCEQLSLQLAHRYPRFADALLADRAESGVTVSITGEALVETAAAGSSVTAVNIGALNLGALGVRAVFDRLLRRPLEILCSVIAEPVVILIDSLDESLTYGGDETVVDMLRAATDDAGELPNQVRLLFTSRPDRRATDGMADITVDLNADAPADDHDVRDFAAQRLTSTTLSEDERAQVADRIATEGHGNFLYARYVLEDLLAHPDHLSDPSSLELPADLADHYRTFLRRELAASRQRWDERYQPVLGALAVARGDGLTRAQLAGALELRASEVDATLRVLAAYLDGDRLRLYHQSFRDFLTTDAEFTVYPGEASERLASYFLDEHNGHWLACDDSYALEYTPSHLVDAFQSAQGRRERDRLSELLRALLTDLGYLSARVDLDHGSVAGIDADYAQAASADPDDIDGTLKAYADALRRESHVLRARPGDVFVQLVNRLSLTTIDGEARPAQPWLNALHPLPLEQALQRTLIQSTEGSHDDVVIAAVAVTPDGTRSASASWDQTVAVWDVPAGQMLRRWQASPEMLQDLALSPDATLILTRDFEDTVVLWDAHTENQLRTWHATTMTVTPDWTKVLLARNDGTVVVHTLADDAPVTEWNTGTQVRALAVTPDATTVVAASSGEPVRVRTWPLDGPFDPVTLDTPPPDATADPTDTTFSEEGVAALGVSEDGSVVAGGGTEGTLWVWSRDDGRLLWQRRADELAVNAVAVTTQQGLALAGGVAATIGIYNLFDGEPIARLRGHTGQIQQLALTADGATLLSAGGEGAVRVWDLNIARSANAARGHDAEVTALALSPDAHLFASGAADGSLIVSALDTGEPIASKPAAHTGWIGGLVFTTDGLLVSSGEDGVVRVWNPNDLESPTTTIAMPGDSWGAGLRSLAKINTSTVLAGAEDGRLVTVDLTSQEATVLPVTSDAEATALAITRDGTTALVGRTDGSIDRCSMRDAAVEQLLSVSEARSLILTADEHCAVVGDLDGVISLIPLDAPGDTVQLRGHVNYVDALALTADDRLLISAGWDATIRIWDLHRHEEIGRYTWELPLARAVATRAAGRDVIIFGDHQGALLFLAIEDVPLPN